MFLIYSLSLFWLLLITEGAPSCLQRNSSVAFRNHLFGSPNILEMNFSQRTWNTVPVRLFKRLKLRYFMRTYSMNRPLKSISKMFGLPNKWLRKATLLFRWRRLGVPSVIKSNQNKDLLYSIFNYICLGNISFYAAQWVKEIHTKNLVPISTARPKTAKINESTFSNT